MTDLCDRSAVELRRLIGEGDLSPLELLESCIARIEAVNPAVNAVVATDYDRAREVAKTAADQVARREELGLLHGLPIGIKDLNETAGLRTTYGSQVYADNVPDEDDAITASVRKAGGIVTAKTNTPEFGAGANTVNAVYGFTGNPFDPNRICGGSSGGSAVAVATSMLPLASGSDLGGSLRTPAAYCGVVGYRSTPGLIADPRRLFGWQPLSIQGPMARSMEDLCLMLAAMVSQDPDDPLSYGCNGESYLSPTRGELADLKVAVSEDLGFAPMDNAIRAEFRSRVEAMSGLFADVVESVPPLANAERIFEVLRATGFLAGYLDLLKQHPDKVGPNVTANTKLGLTYSAEDVARATADQTTLFRDFSAFMADYDCLICPVASVPPFGKEQLFPSEINGEALPTYISWMGITYGLTVTCHPVVVLPCGLDHTGMPFGIQVVGHFGKDRALLGLAASLEMALSGIRGCGQPMPDLAALAGRPEM